MSAVCVGSCLLDGGREEVEVEVDVCRGRDSRDRRRERKVDFLLESAGRYVGSFVGAL